MAFDGSGNFTFPYVWVNDRIAGIKIRADKMDTQFDNATQGFNLCLTRDGQGKPSADLDWNTKKITNMGDGASPQDAATMSNLSKLGNKYNNLINPSFRFWQRYGYTTTTVVPATTGAGQYIPDRWFCYRSAGGLFYSVVQEDLRTNTSAPSWNGVKLIRTAANANVETITIGQSIDTQDADQLRQWGQYNNGGVGNYALFSCYLMKGANFSGALTLEVLFSTTSRANIATGAGWTSIGTTAVAAGSLNTTTFTRQSYAAAIIALPSGVQSIGVRINWTPVGVAGADDSLHISGCILEASSFTTPTNYKETPFYTDMARCERYYQKNFGLDTAPADGVAVVDVPGVCTVAGTVKVTYYFRTRMQLFNTATYYRSALGGTAGKAAGFIGGAWLDSTAFSTTDATSPSSGFSISFPLTGSLAGSSYITTQAWTLSAEF